MLNDFRFQVYKAAITPKQIFPSKINGKHKSSRVCGVIGILPSLFNTVVRLSFYNVAGVKRRARALHDWSHRHDWFVFFSPFFYIVFFSLVPQSVSRGTENKIRRRNTYVYTAQRKKKKTNPPRPRRGGTKAGKRDFDRFIWFYDDADDVDRHVDVVGDARLRIWRRGIMSARE